MSVTDETIPVQEQIDELTQLVVEISASVAAEAKARAEADEALAAELGSEGFTEPREPWTEAAGDDANEELAQWVKWVIATYGFASTFQIPDCWPQHAGVVEEFAALRGEWRQAHKAAYDSGALVAWHRHLGECVTRLHTYYSIKNCATGHDG